MATLSPTRTGPAPNRERLSHIEDRISFSLFERLPLSDCSLGHCFSLEPGEDPLKEHEHVMTVGVGSPIQLGTLCITSSRLLLLVKSAKLPQLRKWFENCSQLPKPRPSLRLANSFTLKRPSFIRRGSLRNKNTRGVSEAIGQWKSEENLSFRCLLFAYPEPPDLSASISEKGSVNGDKDQTFCEIKLPTDNSDTSPAERPTSPISPSRMMTKALTLLRKSKPGGQNSKSTFYCPIDMNSVQLEELPRAKSNSLKPSTTRAKKHKPSWPLVNRDVTYSPVKTMDSVVRMRDQSPSKLFPGASQQKCTSYMDSQPISNRQPILPKHIRSESLDILCSLTNPDKDEVQSLPEFDEFCSLTVSPSLISETKEPQTKTFSFDLTNAQQISIPFGLISRVERISRFEKTPLPSPLDGFRIVCKNCQTLTILMHPRAISELDTICTSIEFFLSLKNLCEFAQTHRKALQIPDQFQPEDYPGVYQLEREVSRLGLKKTQDWRVCELDIRSYPYILPNSYPPRVVVPLSFADADILRLAPHYREARFPVLCWRHPGNRAVLLRAGLLARKKERAQIDGDFLSAVCQTSSRQGDKLVILSERESSETADNTQPSQTSHERMQTYLNPGCVLECSFTPIPLPKLRLLLGRMQTLLNAEASGDYLTQLHGTRWLREISKLLQTAKFVANKLEEEQMSVLVSFESGSDFTTQVVSLAQLMLDPYYRTMDGFQVLVQKEWISMGHKFQQRHLVTGDHSKEESCVFLQFIDCVWQIMQQFPSVFEFNEEFLHFLILHAYSGQYGDFLANNLDEYYGMDLENKTLSIFTWLHYHNLESNRFYNPTYLLPRPNTEALPSHTFVCLFPECSIAAIRPWTSYYGRYSAANHSESPSGFGLLSMVQLLNAKIAELKQRDNELKQQLSYPSPDGFSDSEEDLFCSKETQARALSFGLKQRSSLKRDIAVPGVSDSERRGFFSLLSQDVISEIRASKDMSVSMYVCSGFLFRQNNPVIGLSKRFWAVCDLNKNYFALFHTAEAHKKQEVPKQIYKLSLLGKVQLSNGSNPSSLSFSFLSKGKTERFHGSTKLCSQIWYRCLSIHST